MPDTHVHPRSTSWGSVLGGWFAALGALAILFPIAALAAGLAPAAQARVDDPTLAFPLVLGLFASWIIGGYVAGRMAAYRKSWHGLMSAVWGLFVALVIALIAGGSAGNFANVSASLPRLDVSSFGNATVFGFVLGIAAVILGGWLGGLLAPTQVVHETVRPQAETRRAPVIERREVVRESRMRRPNAWERLTGRREEAVETRVEREKPTLVPPVERRVPDRDGDVVREEETEVRG